jgi:hypothetical protein
MFHGQPTMEELEESLPVGPTIPTTRSFMDFFCGDDFIPEKS